MRRNSQWLAGGVTVVLGVLSGWATGSAGGSLQDAPAAVLSMAAGLGSSGLVVGALAGAGKQSTWWAPPVLLAAFYTGTWLSSPFHSPAGDTVVLVVAAVPTSIGTALGVAIGRYLASRGPVTPRS
ncbi:hypothetical protein ACIG87_02070 [Micromonospora sp. NPDC051925]|uniref:hypothetical protein n=1 Tax=Micromonospora sp. NPDC051925 TaxID=3364288 RepID=UPI0037C6FD79